MITPVPTKNIRNFCTIAHIDHGKSTLADSIMQFCGIDIKKDGGPTLDSMSLEKDKGITIKSQTVLVKYEYKGEIFHLNLNDSPGHRDFHEEVIKSISACEGSLLIVDATQGVQAQTLCNLRRAQEYNHVIIPVINKVDLPHAQIDSVKKQILELVGDHIEPILVSAKTGFGIKDLLDKIVEKIPAPKGNIDAPLQALVVDSWYNQFLGVTVLLCIKNGILKKNQEVYMLSNPSQKLRIAKIGLFLPKAYEIEQLYAGQMGFLASFSKEIDFRVGDTLTAVDKPALDPLPGFKKQRCVVFCFFLLQDKDSFEQVKKALMKLQLNDSSFFFEHEHVAGWGVGFKCGFLGMFHLEIIQERLRREFEIEVMITNPTVTYKFVNEKGQSTDINSAVKFPTTIELKKGSIMEPMTHCRIITPDIYIGTVMKICIDRRGIQQSIEYLGDSVILNFHIPLNEIITSFSDELTSSTKGYCSFDYDIIDYEKSDLVKMEIKINGELINVLSSIVHRSKAYHKGKLICEKLKEILPRLQISQAIQASIDGRVIAREDISAFRRDVIAKCYGGDITRKRKLLEKQKKGKEKMQSLGTDIKLKTHHIIDIMKI